MEDESHEDHGDHLTADRDLSAFHLNMLTAGSRARASEVMQLFEVTEAELIKYFPKLAKRVAEFFD